MFIVEGSQYKSIEIYQLTTLYICQTMLFINLLLDKFMKNSTNILLNNIIIIIELIQCICITFIGP